MRLVLWVNACVRYDGDSGTERQKMFTCVKRGVSLFAYQCV